MASNPIFTVGDGVIDIPIELRDDPRFQRGARLELVPSKRDIILHPQVQATAPEQPAGDWRQLRGILKDSGFDLNADLEQDKLREFELEERMWRGTSGR